MVNTSHHIGTERKKGKASSDNNMKITEGGTIEISIGAMGNKPAEFTLTLGGEEPVNIHLGPSMTETIIIPVNEIEGIQEFAGKKDDKIRLQEIILNLGLAKIKFGRTS